MSSLSRVCVAVALLASSTAFAAEKLKIERLSWVKSPTVRQYLTYVDSDGRVITGASGENFKLVLDAAEQTIVPTSTTFDQTGETINVVVVAQVSASMQEVLEEVRRGIRNLADGLDAKTKPKMALIGFAADTKKLSDMANPADVESAAGTMAIDNEGVETHMLDAVKSGIDMLNALPKQPVPPGSPPGTEPAKDRKLIVLFSDGIDVNMERKAFANIGKRAAEAGVVIDTIGYAPYEPGKLKNLSELAKQSNGTDRMCTKAADVANQFANIVDEIKKQYVVNFELNLKADKKDHTFQTVVAYQGKNQFSNTVNDYIHPHTWEPKKPFPWLWVGVGVGALVVILLVLWLIFREKEEEVEEEEEQEEAPIAAPVMSAPQKAKTMALDIGSGKLPAVGWIVATSGKHQNTTFKFKSGGRTLIGTTPDCDIIIEDGFMSGQHCEVRLEKGSFTLVDLGSTNGIVVNDKKVQMHELVDNDVFRLGRTEFKFKSIS
jgi:hypothetical protein